MIWETRGKCMPHICRQNIHTFLFPSTSIAFADFCIHGDICENHWLLILKVYSIRRKILKSRSIGCDNHYSWLFFFPQDRSVKDLRIAVEAMKRIHFLLDKQHDLLQTTDYQRIAKCLRCFGFEILANSPDCSQVISIKFFCFSYIYLLQPQLLLFFSKY